MRCFIAMWLWDDRPPFHREVLLCREALRATLVGKDVGICLEEITVAL